MNAKKCKKIRQMVRDIDIETNKNLPWVAYNQKKRRKTDENGETYELPGTITLSEHCSKYWVQMFKRLEKAEHGKPTSPLSLLPQILEGAKALRAAA